MTYYLYDRHSINISIATMSRLLAEYKWSRIVAKKVAAQRNEELRAHWLAKRLDWQPELLVFVDESACAPRTGDRKRGWSPTGLPCFDIQRLARTTPWSVLPAITIAGYLEEPLIIQGAVTMELFEEWFEERLLPQLHIGQIVIMDNARIHGSDVVKELCLHAGIQLEFLPPYSPDYNPIELSFNTLKAWIKRHITMATLFVDFGAFLAYAVSEVGDMDMVGYFKYCGYIDAVFE
jgi:transposase